MIKPLPRAHIVLHCPLADASLLEPFVEACIVQGVELIAAGGDGAHEIEDEIDWIIVADGDDDPARFIVTTAHDTIEEAREFASILLEGKPLQEVRL
jgi:hypothetical protein